MGWIYLEAKVLRFIFQWQLQKKFISCCSQLHSIRHDVFFLFYSLYEAAHYNWNVSIVPRAENDHYKKVQVFSYHVVFLFGDSSKQNQGICAGPLSVSPFLWSSKQVSVSEFPNMFSAVLRGDSWFFCHKRMLRISIITQSIGYDKNRSRH